MVIQKTLLGQSAMRTLLGATCAFAMLTVAAVAQDVKPVIGVAVAD